MRSILFFLFFVLTTNCLAQRKTHSRREVYDKWFESRYVQQPPVYVPGADSARRYYFNHFTGTDSVLRKAIAYGDTLKYLRVYFSFVVDTYGLITEPHFIRIASTRYAQSLTAKTVLYFLEDESYYEKMIKQMLRKIGSWKPAIQEGIPVNCRVEDYFQFWVGTTGPPLF